ncbi:MobV family relaxase [Listeria fleischmannii]|nr:MobV family relaxase [Listeria fleischmannii]
MKAGNLSGLQHHVQRETQHHTNPDIDTTKSHLNYDLIHGDQSISFHKHVQDIIASQRTSQRAIRKDAVLVHTWIISSDTAFFEELSPSETKRYFEVATQYFADRYGTQNIAYAHVHLDETTPHMHIGIVPMTEDGRLSAKTLFSRNALREIQGQLASVLQMEGFDIQRGEENSKREHLSVAEFKLQAKQRELERLEHKQAELIAKSTQLDPTKFIHAAVDEQVEQKQPGWFGKWEDVPTGRKILDATTFDEIKDLVEGYQAQAIQIERQQHHIQSLEQKQQQQARQMQHFETRLAQKEQINQHLQAQLHKTEKEATKWRKIAETWKQVVTRLLPELGREVSQKIGIFLGKQLDRVKIAVRQVFQPHDPLRDAAEHGQALSLNQRLYIADMCQWEDQPLQSDSQTKEWATTPFTPIMQDDSYRERILFRLEAIERWEQTDPITFLEYNWPEQARHELSNYLDKPSEEQARYLQQEVAIHIQRQERNAHKARIQDYGRDFTR